MTAALIPTALPGLTEVENQLFLRLANQLMDRAPRNQRKRDLYELRYRFQQIGIAVPPQFQGLDVVAGWPQQAVDVLAERLRAETIVLPGEDIGLGDMWDANAMTTETAMAFSDALIYGPGFITVSAGQADDEPDVLFTVEPATSMTAIYDRRSRRCLAALQVSDADEDDRVTAATLYLPNVNVVCREESGGKWTIDRLEHNLGRVLVVPLINRPRSDRPWGRSEITRAVVAYTAGATRTLLGAEIAREFYSSPKLAILGASEDAFVKPDGSTTNPWEVYLGRVLALGLNEADQIPQMQQFAAASPQPYIDQVKMYAQLLAAETAIPAHYLGFVTDNPSSAEAIHAAESRLVMRAKDRQLWFGRSLVDAAKLGLLVRDGELPDNADQLQTLWASPETPTPAATTDAAIKKVQAGILPAGSSVVLEELGYSQTTIERIESDRREAAAGGLVESLKTLAANAAQPPPAVPVDPAQPPPAVDAVR